MEDNFVPKALIFSILALLTFFIGKDFVAVYYFGSMSLSQAGFVGKWLFIDSFVLIVSVLGMLGVLVNEVRNFSS